MVPNGTPDREEPRPRTSSISCSVTASRLKELLLPGDPGKVSEVFRVIVPSGCPAGGFTLIPTALKLAVLTLIVEAPLTGLLALFGSRELAIASLLVVASALRAARYAE